MSETYSGKLRAWIRNEAEGKDSIQLPELARAAAKHFQQDADFVRAFFVTHLYPVVYEIAQKEMSRTRGAGSIVSLGDELVTKTELRGRAKSTSNRWTKWMEHCGDRHIRFVDMKHDDMRAALAERRERGDHEHMVADLIEALDERVPIGKRVGDVFTVDEIEALWEEIQRRKDQEAAD